MALPSQSCGVFFHDILTIKTPSSDLGKPVHKLRHPYLILTEKVNICANRFYEKIGACFVRTYQHHGREINEWHKHLACDPFGGERMDDQRFIAG